MTGAARASGATYRRAATALALQKWQQPGVVFRRSNGLNAGAGLPRPDGYGHEAGNAPVSWIGANAVPCGFRVV